MATEANPTDVSKASGVKQANTHFVLFCYFFLSVILFLLAETFRLLEYRYKTFLTLSEEEKKKKKEFWVVERAHVPSQRKKVLNVRALAADG